MAARVCCRLLLKSPVKSFSSLDRRCVWRSLNAARQLCTLHRSAPTQTPLLSTGSSTAVRQLGKNPSLQLAWVPYSAKCEAGHIWTRFRYRFLTYFNNDVGALAVVHHAPYIHLQQERRVKTSPPVSVRVRVRVSVSFSVTVLCL